MIYMWNLSSNTYESHLWCNGINWKLYTPYFDAAEMLQHNYLSKWVTDCCLTLTQLYQCENKLIFNVLKVWNCLHFILILKFQINKAFTCNHIVFLTTSSIKKSDNLISDNKTELCYSKIWLQVNALFIWNLSIKMKCKQFHTFRTVPKYNRKFVETKSKSTTLHTMYSTWLSSFLVSSNYLNHVQELIDIYMTWYWIPQSG
jgi:hypothetical protein